MKLPRQIYAIRHEPTKKLYIGSSANVRARFKAHMAHLLRGTHPVEDMQTDFNRYGGGYELLVLGEIQTFAERGKEYELMLQYETYDRRYGYNYKDQGAPHRASKGTSYRTTTTAYI